jgi:uncharacterized membrane protein YkvI
MEKKPSAGIGTIFALGAVWFGAHVGGGFASGNQTLQYFVRFGWTAIWFPAIVMAIVGLTAREIIIMAKNHGTYNYRAWALKAYSPFEKIMAIVLEAATTLLFLLATSGAIAGCAALLQSYGIPYLVGVLLTGILLLLLSIFGVKLIARASSIMTIIMVVSLLIITLTGISAKSGDLSAVISTKESTASTWTIIWMGLKYAGFQSYGAITMIPLAITMKSNSDVNKSIGIGFIINAVMICLSCALILAWFPVVKSDTLPILTICKSFDSNLLLAIYSIMLVLAFITTALGAVFGFVTRFEKIIPKPEKLVVKRSLLAVIFMIAGMSISLLGLTRIVMVGYGWTGVIAIFVIIIPMLTVGHFKNRKFLKEKGDLPAPVQE